LERVGLEREREARKIEADLGREGHVRHGVHVRYVVRDVCAPRPARPSQPPFLSLLLTRAPRCKLPDDASEAHLRSAAVSGPTFALTAILVTTMLVIVTLVCARARARACVCASVCVHACVREHV
jgi:hypothetical protein